MTAHARDDEPPMTSLFNESPTNGGRPGSPVKHDPVNHPVHYTSHPSGVECNDITQHMNYNLGTVVAYIWRVDLKDAPIQDLEKAAWFLAREIERRKKMVTGG